MLRIYFLQHWFNLLDPAVEEALYDSLAMRRFVGIDLGREPVPDETTCAAFVICWKSTIWAGGCSTRCNGAWRPKA
jgi:IS5 family transposase